MGKPLAVSGLLVFALFGCHRHMPVGQAHVNEPGAHVISSKAATSIAWNDGRASRVCTLPSGFQGSNHGGRFHVEKLGVLRGHGSGGHGRGGAIDAFLFRLCEARGNGDITAEQYNAAVTELQQMMHQAHAKAGLVGPKGRGQWGPPGPRQRGPHRGFGPPGRSDAPESDPPEPAPARDNSGQQR